jgi:hypothetical protein
MAEGGAGGSSALPRRCLGARAQAARGGARLPPRDAGALLAGVEPPEAEADLVGRGGRCDAAYWLARWHATAAGRRRGR